jgi:hypothetical protein
MKIWIFAFGLLALSSTACKTTSATSSEVQSLQLPGGDLTLDAWVKSCEKDLSDPVEGEASKADLLSISGTDDCTRAFPEIKKIITQFLPKS